MLKNRWFVIFMGVILTFLPGGLYILLAEMLGKYSPWVSFLAVVLGLFIGSAFVSRRYPNGRRDKGHISFLFSLSLFGLLTLTGCTQQQNRLPANVVNFKVTPVSLAASRARPTYILDVSPTESLMMPLSLYEADGKNYRTEKTDSYIGVRRAEVGYNSSICVELDLTDLVEPGDDFREVSSITERITVIVDGLILTEIIDWSYLPDFWGRGTARWGGPYTYCWSSPLDVGIHEVLFQFRQTTGHVRSYRWSFTITED